MESADRGAADSLWDTCVVYVERRQRWWWNAWRPSTVTELSGFAESEEQARREMARAVVAAGPSPSTHVVRSAYP
ncbi:hypothetical protein [Pseudonocardia kunmingensis]|uniref:DUF1508 domain-containing protein n=1 Tax=Pseudonocardia kunmingensis TaxID=630975 RepID=A0A543DZM0_9PSEU|nr:hypothetical protein [Pseudonocardia kunmingensis]TQM14786.1 hypothetical protein FB558_1562 [Pseudonocardia kunmingensis]